MQVEVEAHPFMTPAGLPALQGTSTAGQWTVTCCHALMAWRHVCAGMRRIDLTCLIASPILVGFLMTYGSTSRAVAFIALWNLASWGPECLLLRYSQSQMASLRADKARHVIDTTGGDPEAPGSFWAHTAEAWGTYLHQGAMPAAVALALVYLTVLSLGSLPKCSVTFSD